MKGVLYVSWALFGLPFLISIDVLLVTRYFFGELYTNPNATLLHLSLHSWLVSRQSQQDDLPSVNALTSFKLSNEMAMFATLFVQVLRAVAASIGGLSRAVPDGALPNLHPCQVRCSLHASLLSSVSTRDSVASFPVCNSTHFALC